MVVCDPASPEVARRKNKAKTGRIDARKMVRARDGGDRGAMAPVRVPSLEEEDAKRLLRRRERPVKERTRIANTIGGLLRLHGISGQAPRKPGFRERVDALNTGRGMPLPPEIRAEIPGLADRLGRLGGRGPEACSLRGGAGRAARHRRQRRAASGWRTLLPGFPQSQGTGEHGGPCSGALGERRHRSRPGDRQGRQFDAAQASDPDGLALAVSPAGQRTLPAVQELRERPRRSLAETGDCRPGAQASGGAVALRHYRIGARGRRFLKSLSRGGRET